MCEQNIRHPPLLTAFVALHPPSSSFSFKNMTDFLKAAKPYVIGGASGMAATCVIQPIDIVKVRLQLGATGGPFGVAASIIKNEGFGTLYTGLSAGLLRQATYVRDFSVFLSSLQ